MTAGNDAPDVIDGYMPVRGAAALARLTALQPAGDGWRNEVALLNLGGVTLGGQIAAHCLVAASGRAGFVPVALHAVFVAAPDPKTSYNVLAETAREGRRLVHHLVRIMQADKLIAHCTVTLSASGAGQAAPGFQYQPGLPAAPVPGQLRTRGPGLSPLEGHAKLRQCLLTGYPFLDIRLIPPRDANETRRRFWLRVPDADGLNETAQSAMLTLVSDFWLTLPVHSLPSAAASAGENFMTTSLDHAIWLYEVPACDRWLMFEAEALVVARGLATVRAFVWSEDGRAVASVFQQVLIRRGLDG